MRWWRKELPRTEGARSGVDRPTRISVSIAVASKLRLLPADWWTERSEHASRRFGDERCARAQLLRCAIDELRYPLSPRLLGLLRAILAKLERAIEGDNFRSVDAAERRS